MSISERSRRPIRQPSHPHAVDYALSKGRGATCLLSKGLVRVTRESADDDLPLILPTHWLVQALVIERASHAYEVGARYEHRFGSFAPTAQNSVYNTLDRLHALRFVYSAPSTAASLRGGLSSRTIYTATPEGVEAHRQWLVSRIRARYWRIELLARIATGGCLPRADLLSLIGLYEQMAIDHREQIAHLVAPVGGTAPAELVSQLVYDEQQAIIDAQLTWVQVARRQIRQARS